jgi:hypothetical protein
MLPNPVYGCVFNLALDCRQITWISIDTCMLFSKTQSIYSKIAMQRGKRMFKQAVATGFLDIINSRALTLYSLVVWQLLAYSYVPITIFTFFFTFSFSFVKKNMRSVVRSTLKEKKIRFQQNSISELSPNER